MSRVEEWVSQRREFVELCRKHAVVYALLQLADKENWPVEMWLSQCVIALAEANSKYRDDLLMALNYQKIMVTIYLTQKTIGVLLGS